MTLNLESMLGNVSVDAGGCFNWGGGKDPRGYGRLCVSGKPWCAHRAMYTVVRGEIPTGMHVCHHCDNPSCCNPAHLFLGTHQDNMRDRDQKGRLARGSRIARAILSESDIPKIVELYNGGMTQTAIAAKFGIASRTVGQVLAGDHWSHVERPPVTGKLRKKLPAEKLRAIRSQLEAGVFQRDIARHFGISQSAVSAINRNKIGTAAGKGK